MQKMVGVGFVIVLGALMALWLGGAGMMGFGGFGMDSGMMSGIVAMIAPTYLIIIIGAGLLFVFWLSRPRGQLATAKISSPSALDISKTRYANGEITKEQYDTIKHDLRK